MNTSAPTTAIPILKGFREIASQYDVVLCDIWGVVHNGQRHHEAACAALAEFRAAGGTVVLVTNAPRPNPPILDQLKLLGVPDGTFDDIVTSGDVTLRFIAERGMDPVYHIGPERDLTLFDILEDQTGVCPPLVDLEDAAYVVCTGLFLDETETPEDYGETLSVMKALGLDFISANPDLIVHVGERLMYCAGALAQAYEQRGGRVFQAGKPHAPIYERALELARKARPGVEIDKSRVLAIGDAMRTDIRGACDFGVDALFVTSGIHRDELHPDSALDEAAFKQFIADADITPTAAMPALVW